MKGPDRFGEAMHSGETALLFGSLSMGFALRGQRRVFSIGKENLSDVEIVINLFEIALDAEELLGLDRLLPWPSFPCTAESFPEEDPNEGEYQEDCQTQQDREVNVNIPHGEPYPFARRINLPNSTAKHPYKDAHRHSECLNKL